MILALVLAFVAGVIATLAIVGMIQRRRERERREQLAAEHAQDEGMRRQAFVSHEIAVAVLSRPRAPVPSPEVDALVVEALDKAARDIESEERTAEANADILEAEATGAGFFPEPSGAPPMPGRRLNRPLYFRNSQGAGGIDPA